MSRLICLYYFHFLTHLVDINWHLIGTYTIILVYTNKMSINKIL